MFKNVTSFNIDANNKLESFHLVFPDKSEVNVRRADLDANDGNKKKYENLYRITGIKGAKDLQKYVSSYIRENYPNDTEHMMQLDKLVRILNNHAYQEETKPRDRM